MLNDQVNRLYLLIGRIASDFSSIEQLWYLIFTCLMPQTPRAVTDAIFEKFKTGRQQRDLILTVAEAAKSPLLPVIKEMTERTWKAADRRNAAVHSIIHVADYIVPPRIFAAGISKPSKLAEKDIPAEIADLHRTVAMLEVDMQELRMRYLSLLDPSIDLPKELQTGEHLRQSVLQIFEKDPILRAVEGRS